MPCDSTLSPTSIIRLLINEQSFTSMIDTGAAPNLMDVDTLNKYGCKCKELKNQTTVTDVSRNKFDSIGKVDLPCVYRNNLYQLEWWVMKQPIPYSLFGRQGLGVMFPGWKRSIRYQSKNYPRWKKEDKNSCNYDKVLFKTNDHYGKQMKT